MCSGPSKRANERAGASAHANQVSASGWCWCVRKCEESAGVRVGASARKCVWREVHTRERVMVLVCACWCECALANVRMSTRTVVRVLVPVGVAHPRVGVGARRWATTHRCVCVCWRQCTCRCVGSAHECAGERGDGPVGTSVRVRARVSAGASAQCALVGALMCVLVLVRVLALVRTGAPVGMEADALAQVCLLVLARTGALVGARRCTCWC